MKKLAVLAAAVAVILFSPPASAVRAAPIHRMRLGLATNWAGYAAHGTFNSVSTTWTEPSIKCAATEHSAVASFAGLDGAGSSTVEQIGTLDTCQNGTVVHKAFYEIYPKAAFRIAKRVRAGDSLTASVVFAGSNTFTLTLRNNTAGWKFTTNQQSSGAQRASAEAITEAPSTSGGAIMALSNFGRIKYGGTTANGQPLANFGPEAITMVTNNNTVKAQPTAISGGSFAVVWHHA